MTPRSRKPVMLAIFGNSDPKSSQNNISDLLEESEENESQSLITPVSSGDIPLNSLQINNLRSSSESDLTSNGLPEVVVTSESASSSNPDSLSSAFRWRSCDDFECCAICLQLLFFREYFHTRGNMPCDPVQDDDSFSSQPDDFESSNEYQKLETSSSASSQEMDKIMSQSNMSESLLYCLDGNNVSPAASPAKSRKRPLNDSCKEESPSESLKRPLIEADLTDLWTWTGTTRNSPFKLLIDGIFYFITSNMT